MSFPHSIRVFARTLLRRKLFSFINLSGLAFGIAFIILIGQFLYFEFSYNRFFKNIDHIYRLVDATENDYRVDYRVGDAIVENIPGVKNTGLMNDRQVEVNHGEQVFQFDHLLYVDIGFFEIFEFPFVHGDAGNALRTVEAVVLTESTARRLFGSDDPIGRELVFDHEYEMMVTGVVQDLPPNTSFRADLFVSAENTRQKRLPLSMSCLEYDGKDDSQCKYPFNIFVELHEQADIAAVALQIPALFNLEDYRFPDKVSLTSFKTNYFDTQYGDHDLAHGNLGLVKILSWIGLIVLALAVINYVNLTTAGYKYRLTEIGIKKCLGVNARILRTQLLTESFLFCLCAALLGITIAEAFLPHFNQFIGKPLQIEIFTDLRVTSMFAGFLLFLSLAAGFLPAVMLSRISPLQLFKFGPLAKSGASGYRSALSVFQFGVTIVLICCLLVMSKQIDYVKHKNTGFDTEQLLYLNIHPKMRDRLPALTDRLAQYHGLKSLTITNGIPGKININLDHFDAIVIDSNTVKTFGFEIVQGRNLLPGDLNQACLINAAALSKFANNDFLGQEVNSSAIVGVISDFHFASLHKKIAPLVLLYSDWGGQHLTMRISGPVDEAIAHITQSWKDLCADYPFDLQFYDETFAAMYRQEENLATLISIFSILAVVISCLGIFGLAVFQSQQRLKEIGIRKVLGATAAEIIAMLSGSFTKWVIAANLLAWPVAYFAATKWLQTFAYRIEIQWWMFAASGGLALAIALLTVSAQAIKAALANPVEALRYE
ncbi:MAG TPA: ABC transporter permease [bacterium]